MLRLKKQLNLNKTIISKSHSANCKVNSDLHSIQSNIKVE